MAEEGFHIFHEVSLFCGHDLRSQSRCTVLGGVRTHLEVVLPHLLDGCRVNELSSLISLVFELRFHNWGHGLRVVGIRKVSELEVGVSVFVNHLLYLGFSAALLFVEHLLAFTHERSMVGSKWDRHIQMHFVILRWLLGRLGSDRLSIRGLRELHRSILDVTNYEIFLVHLPLYSVFVCNRGRNWGIIYILEHAHGRGFNDTSRVSANLKMSLA